MMLGNLSNIYDLPIHSMNVSVHLQHFIHSYNIKKKKIYIYNFCINKKVLYGQQYMITNKFRNTPTGSKQNKRNIYKDCSINVSLDIKTTVLLWVAQGSWEHVYHSECPYDLNCRKSDDKLSSSACPANSNILPSFVCWQFHLHHHTENQGTHLGKTPVCRLV